MRWLPRALFTMLVMSGATMVVVARESSSAAQLYAQLQDEKTTDQAAERLRTAANDPKTRRFLAEHLPALIPNYSPWPVWLNAVRLSGDLKLVDTIPALVPLLKQDNHDGPITFFREETPANDPVGKSLATIGEPAIGAVQALFGSKDTNVRGRVALILANMNSPAADQALELHLTDETDPGVKQLIQGELVAHRKKAIP